MIPPLDRLVRKLETSNLFLRTFAAVACVGGVLAYFWSNGDFFAGPVVFFSNRQLFIIAELSNGVGMGNQLSTWNLSIQSAVDGENFNYNPDYNQVAFFIKLPCYQSVFWAKFTSLFTATKWHRVLVQASMERLHSLLRLLTYSPTTLGSTLGSERLQAKQIIWIFKIFLWILVDWEQNDDQIFAQVLPYSWSWPTFALAASTSKLLAC